MNKLTKILVGITLGLFASVGFAEHFQIKNESGYVVEFSGLVGGHSSKAVIVGAKPIITDAKPVIPRLDRGISSTRIDPAIKSRDDSAQSRDDAYATLEPSPNSKIIRGHIMVYKKNQSGYYLDNIVFRYQKVKRHWVFSAVSLYHGVRVKVKHGVVVLSN